VVKADPATRNQENPGLSIPDNSEGLSSRKGVRRERQTPIRAAAAEGAVAAVRAESVVVVAMEVRGLLDRAACPAAPEITLQPTPAAGAAGAAAVATTVLELQAMVARVDRAVPVKSRSSGSLAIRALRVRPDHKGRRARLEDRRDRQGKLERRDLPESLGKVYSRRRSLETAILLFQQASLSYSFTDSVVAVVEAADKGARQVLQIPTQVVVVVVVALSAD
jgi:hypothetical protein